MQRAEWLRNEVLTAGVEWEENHFVLDRCDVSSPYRRAEPGRVSPT
jgi:hypothetical protein